MWGQAKQWLGVLSWGCVREAGERGRGCLLAHLPAPAHNRWRGEACLAWGGPGSRRALLEQAPWALRSGSGLPSPSHCKMARWPFSCMSVQTKTAYLDKTTSSQWKKGPQRLRCTDTVLCGDFFDGTGPFFFFFFFLNKSYFFVFFF